MSQLRRALAVLLTLTALPALPTSRAAAPPQARVDAFGDPLPPGAVARLGTTRLRHGALVPSVAWSPDGKWLVAAGGSDQAVHLWDPATGKERARLLGHTGNVHAVAFSPDGKLLASGGADKAVCLWEVAALARDDVKPRRLMHDKGANVTALAFQGGKTLLTANYEGGIRVWDLSADREVRHFGDGLGRVQRLALAPDGKTLAAVHTSGEFGKTTSRVWLWDVARGEKLRQIGIDQHEIYSVAFSPDGETLATGGSGPELWEVASGTRLVRTEGGYVGYTPSVAFSPDGRSLFAGGSGFLREWKVSTGRVVRSFPVDQIYTYSIAFSPNRKTMATGTTSGVGLWDVATGKPLHSAEGHQGEVSALVFSANGKELLTAGYGRAMYRWDLGSGKVINKYEGPSTWNTNMRLFPDGKTLLLQGRDLALLVLDAATLKERARFTNHLPPRHSASTPMYFAISPDGKTVASTTMGVDHHIRLWQADTGKEVLKIATGKDNSSGLGLSPDGKTIYSGNVAGPVCVWEAETGKLLRKIGAPGYGTHSLTLSPDGRRLAVFVGGAVVIWDAATGVEVRQIPWPRGYRPTLAFTPDGRSLAIFSAEEPVRFWEVASGKMRLEVRGHSGPVKALTFTRDGLRFATGSTDTTALVWDVRALLRADDPTLAGLSPKVSEELWADLAGDAPTSYRAVVRLSRFPKEAVALIGKRLSPVVPAKRIDKLIADLDADEFETREAATKELINLGSAIEPALKRALASKPPLEVYRRLQRVLSALDSKAGEAVARLRVLRAVEVLEGVGTPEARKVLEVVAKGDPALEATAEAKAALERLAGKP